MSRRRRKSEPRALGDLFHRAPHLQPAPELLAWSARDHRIRAMVLEMLPDTVARGRAARHRYVASEIERVTGRPRG